MKKFLFLKLLVLVACMSSVLSATAHDFSAAYNGKTIYYNITSSANKTVEVTYNSGWHDDYYGSYESNVTIPQTVSYNSTTYTVTGIGQGAFEYSGDLTSVSIPSSVTYIDYYAFNDCPGLTTITIPNAVTRIEDGAFDNCLSLSSVTLGTSLQSIGAVAFKGCRELSSIVIPNNVTTIGQNAFEGCTYLSEVTIGSAVTSIGAYAFKDCNIRVEYGEAVTYPMRIVSKAITPPTITSTTFDTYQYSYAFVRVPTPYAKSLYDAAPYWSNFRTPNGISIISPEQYYDFKVDNFFYIITGSNTVKVTNEYNKASGGRSYTGTVYVPSQVVASYTGTSVTYTVTGVDDYAFSETWPDAKLTSPNDSTLREYPLGSLKAVILPNTIQTIGESAFHDCPALTTVVLGTGVTSIGANAFDKCPALTALICKRSTPPTVQSSTFSGYNGNIYSTATLYVPSTTAVNTYKAATYWKNFTNIKVLPTLDEALNVPGATFTFTSTGTYPWQTMVDGDGYYAISGNGGVHGSTSTLTATVTVPAGGAPVSFDFKAWGEGSNSIYDKCIFSVDGTQQFSYGARQNEWESYSVDLSAGTHTLTWTYTKDNSVNPMGDYFAVRNVKLNIEPYVVYTPSNTTLTFYYDGQIQYHEGTLYLLNEGIDSPEWYTDGTYANVTKVVFDPSFAGARPTSTHQWFASMSKLTSITGLSYLNTENVTRMTSMFDDCDKLTSLDLSNFNTAKVTNMYQMFYGCNNLMAIYVADGWTTDAVINSYQMFYACTKLVGSRGTTYSSGHVDKAYAHIDGGYSNPGYLCDLKEAYACYTPSNTTLTFYCDNQRCSRTGTIYHVETSSNSPGWYADSTCLSVTKVVFDPSFANARPLTTNSWFSKMSSLTSITGLSYLNTEDVVYMSYMFNRCSKLTSLDLSNFNTANVKYMSNMFQDCTNLTIIYAGDGWTTDAVTSSGNMFSGCTKLVGGQGTTYSSSHVDKAYAHIDGGPSNPGYLTEWKEAYACYTSSNTTLTFYYDNQRSSRTGTTYDLNTGDGDPGWYTDGTKANVTKVVFNSSFANARPTSAKRWFSGMENLVSITGLSYLNTSEVTNMMSMFFNCNKLTSLDLSNFNTAKVTNMSYMFQKCTGLTSLNVSSFNTSNVTTMSYMFEYCSGLTSLDLSHFNTAKVTGMGYMFRYCSGLTSLDLSSFNTAKVAYMQGMFQVSSKLKTIYVGNGWTTNAVTTSTSMFTYCTKLVGGKGTTYDANHVDAAYAHIDGGTSNPGYLTDINASQTGDVNGDGSTTIADVTLLIDILLNNVNAPAEADVNGDGFVTIADVTALIDQLLGN